MRFSTAIESIASCSLRMEFGGREVMSVSEAVLRAYNEGMRAWENEAHIGGGASTKVRLRILAV